MKQYRILYTYIYRDGDELTDYVMINAKSEAEAEEKFFKTRPEYNPYKKQFSGYILECIYDEGEAK